MARLSKDGSSIEFKQSESIPTTAKKFRQSPEIQGFYSFIYDNGLQQEAFEIISEISDVRKAAKMERQAAARAATKAAKLAAKAASAKTAPAKKAKKK